MEKEMATHPSILAWRIPWTEKPCGLQCMELQTVRQDWATLVSGHDRHHHVCGGLFGALTLEGNTRGAH